MVTDKAGMDASFHYPPELLLLLVDTIPRLCPSKRDVITFLRGAGVQRSVISGFEKQLKEDPDSINKFDIVRTTLVELNEVGDAGLRERREILKRVVEFEDFSSCWPDDRLPAQGLVSNVRTLVEVKDSFTRMKQERNAEVRKNREDQLARATELRKRKSRLEEIRQDLNSLFTMENAQARGRKLEDVLNELFDANGILVRESFSRQSEQGKGAIEQIDGVIELDGHVYLVEMKWLKDPVGVADVSGHLVRVFNRGDCRGILISYSGYTSKAIELCKETLSQKVVVLCNLQEFVFLLENDKALDEILRAKILGAIVDKQPFTEVLV